MSRTDNPATPDGPDWGDNRALAYGVGNRGLWYDKVYIECKYASIGSHDSDSH